MEFSDRSGVLEGFKNPDGSLTEAGRKRYSELHDGPLIEKKNDFHSNVDKWGKDAEHNLLAVTGVSGSGKSTAAYLIKDQLPNVDIITMDVYWDNPTIKEAQSKDFNRYLDKHVPEYKKLLIILKNTTMLFIHHRTIVMIA